MSVPFAIVFHFLLLGGTFPAVMDHWEMENGATHVWRVAARRWNVIVDGTEKILAYLDPDEIVEGSVASRNLKTLALKLDYRRTWKSGETGQWYSRVLIVEATMRGNFARSSLEFQCDFMAKNHLGLENLLSVSDNARVIEAGTITVTDGHRLKADRILDVVLPSFYDPKTGRYDRGKAGRPQPRLSPK